MDINTSPMVGTPMLLDPDYHQAPPPDLLNAQHRNLTPAYRNRLCRVGGELYASKTRNVVMEPYVPQVGKMDVDLEMYTAKISAAPDLDQMN
jgi:hypothetical protein